MMQCFFLSTSEQDTKTIQPHLGFLKKWYPIDYLVSKERSSFQIDRCPIRMGHNNSLNLTLIFNHVQPSSLKIV